MDDSPSKLKIVATGVIALFVAAFLWDPPAWEIAQHRGIFLSRYDPLAGRSTRLETVQIKLDDGRTIVARMATLQAASTKTGAATIVTECKSLIFRSPSYFVGGCGSGL